ncbi:FAD binding domain-containing protein [Nocardia takedensis]|uniref:FAD binding domain-containing protein n=1 Tax=Nocardia takedensis TaxID=259390 RepID=UPI003F763195
MDLDTIREVVTARERADLACLDADTAILAGGTFLYSEPQEHLRRLVDLTGFEWPALVETSAGLEIAATCTLAEFAGTVPGRELGGPRPDLPGTALFAAGCRALLASHKIWRTATVGGNICLALPAGGVLAALTALDADALIWSPDGVDRRIALREFVLGPQRTALAPGEVLRSVTVPRRSLLSHTAFRKIAIAPTGRSGSVVMGRREPDGRVALTITGATMRPVVLDFPAPPDLDDLDTALAALDPRLWFDDPHGAPDWRRHVTGILAREVAEELRSGSRS